jgi:hypothetical protein
MEERKESIFYCPGALATLANEHAVPDLKRFLASLQLWNNDLPPLFLLCTIAVEQQIKGLYKGELNVSTDLEPYKGLSRQQMEHLPSKKGYPNLFYDFTAEKTALLSWALSHEKNKQGVLFCDSDIFWLAPLPSIPQTATLAVSAHGIRSKDEAKFGIYNAGFFWTKDPVIPIRWRDAIKTSRFFEQAAIEELVTHNKTTTHIFGQECNYGWWRLFQAPVMAEEKKKEWTIFRSTEHSGILVNGTPLICIHTHFDEKNDLLTKKFNEFLITKLKILKNQPKVKQLLQIINKG